MDMKAFWLGFGIVGSLTAVGAVYATVKTNQAIKALRDFHKTADAATKAA